MSIFKFKEFVIIQEKSAMKVGTDGVLLGAWTSCENSKNILDIGCGTGLITLMLAQRNINANLTGIEIDQLASKEAQLNVNQSDWTDRITIIETSLQDFNPAFKFDLIISNPPFFPVVKSKERRAVARHVDALSFEELVCSAAKALDKNGIFSVILPKSTEVSFCDIAAQYNLYSKRLCYVRGNKRAKIKRVMLEFSFVKSTVKEEDLIIEKSRHQYTREYINLCKKFYLNM